MCVAAQLLPFSKGRKGGEGPSVTSPCALWLMQKLCGGCTQ
jgi:hypothetical protein